MNRTLRSLQVFPLAEVSIFIFIIIMYRLNLNSCLERRRYIFIRMIDVTKMKSWSSFYSSISYHILPHFKMAIVLSDKFSLPSPFPVTQIALLSLLCLPVFLHFLVIKRLTVLIHSSLVHRVEPATEVGRSDTDIMEVGCRDTDIMEVGRSDTDIMEVLPTSIMSVAVTQI